MSDLLRLLKERNSAPKLTDPAPGPAELEEIFQAALRAPDHAWLRPWRFLTIAGERRAALGELLERCLVARNPEADETARTKALNAPMRAPLVVVAIVKLSEHPKVPHVEQRLSAGCAAQGILLATQALGYAGIWRTGAAAFDRAVMDGLGLAADEEIVGFIYLGTRDGKPKPVPELATADFVSAW
ncbi:MAG: nitroreductase [Halioglobus sp.]|nr:nitroreductase [Halioglobus sp.]